MKLKSIPKNIFSFLKQRGAPLSHLYWEARYVLGGTSGPGSYGELAQFKARALNDFVEENDIDSVVEFGCGDGTQLELASYPRYVGLDVSRQAVRMCHERFEQDHSKSFFLYDPACFVDHHDLFSADLALSLDVIYHLVEDSIFTAYMTHLFEAADQFVAIYSSNSRERSLALHVRHRPFTDWIANHAKGWQLLKTVINSHAPSRKLSAGTPYDLFIYENISQAAEIGSAAPPSESCSSRLGSRAPLRQQRMYEQRE